MSIWCQSAHTFSLSVCLCSIAYRSAFPSALPSYPPSPIRVKKIHNKKLLQNEKKGKEMSRNEISQMVFDCYLIRDHFFMIFRSSFLTFFCFYLFSFSFHTYQVSICACFPICISTVCLSHTTMRVTINRDGKIDARKKLNYVENTLIVLYPSSYFFSLLLPHKRQDKKRIFFYLMEFFPRSSLSLSVPCLHNFFPLSSSYGNAIFPILSPLPQPIACNK